jgi:hypothetical protein
MRILSHHLHYSILAACGLVFVTTPAPAQLFSFGVKGGVPLTDAFSHVSLTDQPVFPQSASGYNRRYVVGPTVELHFPLHFSFEVDALYRRNGFAYTTYQYFFYPVGPTYTAEVNYLSRASINDWQVPLLAKYELRGGMVRPFVNAGVVYRHVSGTVTSSFLAPNHASSVGAAVGAGLTFKVGPLRLSPEIRYTHWGTRPFANGLGPIFFSTNNQTDLLVGFTF